MRWATGLALLGVAFGTAAAEPSSFYFEPIGDLGRERADLLDALAAPSGAGTTTFPETKLPPGDYTLCGLPPAKIYRNMVGSVTAPNATISAVVSPWRDYILKSVGSLTPWTAPDRVDLDAAIRTRVGIDQSVRSLIGRSNVGEKASPKDAIYQAALWATSCLVDRQNSIFVRQVLTTRGWPKSPSPAEDGSATHGFFLLFQHAVLGEAETERFVASAGVAFRRRQLSGEDYARISDRFLENARGYQLYGTSRSILPEGETVDNLLGCRAETDRRRASIGLAPLKPTAKLRQAGKGDCA